MESSGEKQHGDDGRDPSCRNCGSPNGLAHAADCPARAVRHARAAELDRAIAENTERWREDRARELAELPTKLPLMSVTELLETWLSRAERGSPEYVAMLEAELVRLMTLGRSVENFVEQVIANLHKKGSSA